MARMHARRLSTSRSRKSVLPEDGARTAVRSRRSLLNCRKIQKNLDPRPKKHRDGPDDPTLTSYVREHFGSSNKPGFDCTRHDADGSCDASASSAQDIFQPGCMSAQLHVDRTSVSLVTV